MSQRGSRVNQRVIFMNATSMYQLSRFGHTSMRWSKNDIQVIGPLSKAFLRQRPANLSIENNFICNL